MTKKILVTGGAGYIGSHTVHHFLKHSYSPSDIIVFDNLVYGHQEFIPKGVRFIKGDLLNKTDINQVFKDHSIDRVIHFAAYAYVGESMTNPGKYFENNVVGGLNLLKAMLSGNCKKIVFSSSCAIYGTPSTNPITENFPTNPINPYGETKLMFEKILTWYWQLHQIKSVRLRYFNAAGANFGIGEAHDPEPHLIPLVINTALGKRKFVRIYGTNYPTPDGSCLRDYIHVLDLADAHLKALVYLDKSNSTTDFFNIGTGKGTSVKEIVSEVKKHQPNFEVREEQARPGDPAELVADPSKANKILGWKSRYTIENIINDAWQWHPTSNNSNGMILGKL